MNFRELTALLEPVHGKSEARAMARMVMEERFGLSLTDLLLGKDKDLPAKEHAELKKIASSLAQGCPVQQVLGYAWFCGHRFKVTPDVLIPRPETEELVGWALEHPASRYLDLGTGSGCIAISLALALPDAFVTAVDISRKALHVARENGQSLGCGRLNFVEADILELPFDPLPLLHSIPLDCIVSNPPYVRVSEEATMAPTVRDYEPHEALFVPDSDPLIFYKAIAAIGRCWLEPAGRVFVEVNTALAQETARLFREAGFVEVEVRNDQFGHPRMVGAIQPERALMAKEAALLASRPLVHNRNYPYL